MVRKKEEKRKEKKGSRRRAHESTDVSAVRSLSASVPRRELRSVGHRKAGAQLKRKFFFCPSQSSVLDGQYGLEDRSIALSRKACPPKRKALNRRKPHAVTCGEGGRGRRRKTLAQGSEMKEPVAINQDTMRGRESDGVHGLENAFQVLYLVRQPHNSPVERGKGGSRRLLFPPFPWAFSPTLHQP